MKNVFAIFRVRAKIFFAKTCSQKNLTVGFSSSLTPGEGGHFPRGALGRKKTNVAFTAVTNTEGSANFVKTNFTFFSFCKILRFFNRQDFCVSCIIDAGAGFLRIAVYHNVASLCVSNRAGTV